MNRPVGPWHATTHAALGVAFGLWAQRLRDRRDDGADQQALESAETLNELEAEVDMLRLELGEMQERAEFAERLLVHQQDAQPRNPPLGERP